MAEPTAATVATAGRAAALDHLGRERLECEICHMYFHRLDTHVTTKHKINPERYMEDYPDSKLRSPHAEAVMVEAGRKGAKARVENREEREKSTKTEEAPPVEGEFRFGVARLYEREGISEDGKKFIPEFDPGWVPGKDEKTALEDLALGIQDEDNSLIVGPTGCGKSLLAMQLACALGQPMRRVNLHGDVRAADFTGEKVVDIDPETKQPIVTWRDGVLPQAMRDGHWLLLDELDAATPAVLFVLQGVLEPGRSLVLLGNGGEVVRAHSNFRVIATANTLGRGDDTGLYTGTRVLNEAFLDRFGTVIRKKYPTKDTEIKILMGRSGIDKDTATQMVTVMQRIRESAAKDEVGCTFSTRRGVAWATKAKQYGDIRRAAAIAVLNKLEGNDRKVVEGTIQRHIGER